MNYHELIKKQRKSKSNVNSIVAVESKALKNEMSQPRMQVGVTHCRPKKKIDLNLNGNHNNGDETKNTVRESCRECFHQYLKNSTLHGLRYVGDQSLTLFER